ncbi:hypothetical protein F7725_010413 [Dissostichus mawsoni]|uniref:Uncharacterized protein n=1 Tax=Dissostichus mawsoni TaxID=36200 RepID=A0A7J5XNE2_DISMA|nr:hypothetical protein F7725_010413 [Dissostichus mawsoni]
MEEDQAWLVDMGDRGSQPPSIPPSQHLPGPPAAGPEHRGEPCYLEQPTFFTYTLVMLMFDNKTSDQT